MRQPGLRYVAVAAELQHMIEAGQFKAGDRIPGQQEIARRFGVALTTMRAAIGILERSGFLRSGHGLSQVRELLWTIQLNGVAARGAH